MKTIAAILLSLILYMVWDSSKFPTQYFYMFESEVDNRTEREILVGECIELLSHVEGKEDFCENYDFNYEEIL